MKKNLFILLLLVASNQLVAQLATKHTYLSSNYTEVLIRDEVTIYAKAIPGKKSSDAATIYWQIKNKTYKPIFLEGNYTITGKPISGTLSNGQSAGKNKVGGALPLSKVAAFSTGEFQSSAEWINDIDAIVITLDVIHKGDNIKSGNAN
jgi:hypothetical protein